ncbi:MAG: hypothetical protein AVDCRST_MAG64-1914 [uncultured Phycisphaerae bacterium]|uniref:HTH HARE-type domain-containing protein n=1 Tax=uncultured Phycisphaerae bacterium TaxID=904963 RepID=A0A6J4P9I2_9BACT|nr:MAG: hypothetical protein AVDCRST_MAG64-1914 [uncultured Phycisphaerae bacterium]
MARPANGANLNIVELQRILNERKRQLDKLMRRREKLQKQVDAIDAEIGKVAGDGIGGGGGTGGNGRSGGGAGSRARNDRPLPDYIEEVMGKNGKPMRVGEIVDAVKSAGYKSNSASFKNIVNQMLIKERKRFQQVDRGIYGLAKK